MAIRGGKQTLTKIFFRKTHLLCPSNVIIVMQCFRIEDLSVIPKSLNYLHAQAVGYFWNNDSDFVEEADMVEIAASPEDNIF